MLSLLQQRLQYEIISSLFYLTDAFISSSSVTGRPEEPSTWIMMLGWLVILWWPTASAFKMGIVHLHRVQL